MIEIDRDSWHGRLTRYVFGDWHIRDTPSICPYFWSVIASLFMAPIKYTVEAIEYWGHAFKAILVIVFVLAILGSIYYPTLTLIFGVFIIVMANAVWGIVEFGKWYTIKYPYVAKDIPDTPPKKEREKQKSLVWEWLKARKDKACPKIIEVME